MSNSTLDPKLYLAARTGNIESFILHAHLTEAELAAFNANVANDVVINVRNGEAGIDVANHDPRQPTRPLSGVTCARDTVLHIATRFGQTSLAKKICQVRTSFLTRPNKKRETPLHYVAQAGNRDLVRYFIRLARQGGRRNLALFLFKKNQDGETALYQAVLHQHHEVVEELMHAAIGQARIPRSIPGNQQIISPLYLATVLRSLPIVTCLASLLPSNVPRRAYLGPEGQTALHIAALSGKTSFVEKILEWKGGLAVDNHNSSRYTPLHYAALGNKHAVAKMLLGRDRKSAYMADSSGLYPVHVAAKLGHLEVVIELFKQCPDSGELLDKQGRNFLHLAVKEKRVGIVQWVCENITDFEKAIRAQDNEGNTHLHLAVTAGDPITVLHLILGTKVPLNWVDKNEMTPLDLAYAQRKCGFSDQQNPDHVIYRTLCWIGCTRRKHRPTFHNLELENDPQNDEEREKKEMESCESMAKSMSIGSVLIASATFAAAFTVYGVYIKKKELYDNPQLKLVFEIFFLLDAYAFLCSIIATGLLVEAALTFLDLDYRKRYLLLCTALVVTAAKCSIVAFTTAAYLVLTPVRKWLAILITVMGAIATILIQPRYLRNLLFLPTLIKYRSCKVFRWIGFQWAPLLVSNICYIFFVYVVLTGSLSHTTSRTEKLCRIIDCSSDPYVIVVIVYLGYISFLLFRVAVKDLIMKPGINLRSMFI